MQSPSGQFSSMNAIFGSFSFTVSSSARAAPITVIPDVLQASSALTQAESNVLAAATNYEKSRVQLDLFTADTLAKMGIEMSEAESGQVKKMPTVPGAIPATDTTQSQQPKQ